MEDDLKKIKNGRRPKKIKNERRPQKKIKKNKDDIKKNLFLIPLKFLGLAQLSKIFLRFYFFYLALLNAL